MFMEILFKICDPSKSFLIGISSVKSEKYKLDSITNKQIKAGGAIQLSLGLLFFELILIFNYNEI